jgi:hypothetical protein
MASDQGMIRLRYSMIPLRISGYLHIVILMSATIDRRDGTTQMPVRWPNDVYEDLRRLAYERHEYMSHMVITATREYLARQENTPDAAAAPERRAA